jgi:hypothetical protein
MSRIGSLLFFSVLLWCDTSFADRSCLPDFNSLQLLETTTPGASQEFIKPLKSMNMNGLFQTKVQAVIRIAQDLEMLIRFDPEFDGVSLPYNLYAVLVVADGAVLSYMDFTRECAGPGIGFFPGGEIRLPRIKLIGADPQKLQIMVWGRL